MSELPPRKRKKRKGTTGSGRKRKKRQEAGSPDPVPGDDRLGSLIEQHAVSMGGLIIVCGVLLLIGVGILGWGYTQEAVNRMSVTAMIIGGFIMLMGLILFGINVVNVGRRLELRKRGVRFSDHGRTTEMLWSEIAHVEVDRLDATNVGVGTKYTRSSDAAAVSGPLTKTEFTVTLHSDTGEVIVLTSIFLRTVADPKKLISSLKLRAGT